MGEDAREKIDPLNGKNKGHKHLCEEFCGVVYFAHAHDKLSL